MSDELTCDWRKLRDEEIHDLDCSRNITGLSRSRGMRGGMWHVLGGEENGIQLCGGKTEGAGQQDWAGEYY